MKAVHSIRFLCILSILLLTNTLFCNTIYSQQKHADSLQENNSSALLEKAKEYRGLTKSHLDSNAYPAALYAAKKSIETYSFIHRQATNSHKPQLTIDIAFMHREAGIVNYYLGNTVDAIWHYNQAIDLLTPLDVANDSILIRQKRVVLARCYNGKAVIYSYQGDYPKSLKNFIKAADIYTMCKDLGGAAKIYNNIGILNKEQQNLDEALMYYELSEQLYTQLNDTAKLANLYINIGTLYYNKNAFDTALNYVKKSLEFYQRNDNIDGIANALLTYADIYVALGLYNDAVHYYERAQQLIEKSHTKTINLAMLIGMANVHYNLKDLRKALDYSQKAFGLALEMNALKRQIDILEIQHKIYEAWGFYKKALEIHKTYKYYTDSLYNKDKTMLTTKLQLSFDLAQKQQEIAMLSKEKQLNMVKLEKNSMQSRKQRIIIVFITSILFLIIAFSVFIFNRLRINNRQKNVIEQQKILVDQKRDALQHAFEEIRNQKEEIQNQRDAITNQKEKAFNLFNDLRSSIHYAKHIQSALLPSKIYFDQLFKDHFVLFKPHSIVSGDFYWIKEVNEWRIVVAADCTGHGVPGALMSMLGITFLNEIVKYEEVEEVADVLNVLRDNIVYALKSSDKDNENNRDGMDISIAAYNAKTGKLHFSGANNNMYIVRHHNGPMIANGRIIEPKLKSMEGYLYLFKGDRMPIGYDEIMGKFSQTVIDVTPGDQIFLFSDGYADQFGGQKDKKLMYKPFQKLILSNSLKSFNQQYIEMNRFFDQWKGDRRQVDDVLVLGVKLKM
ncbi:MAG: tetratricopeptide repeat protein [Salinivirgaceae bacterium]|jgi:tetratricopeptide (TPR) repeat protein|nr:tetratricopeptide repeat protein [Salinivirgaceae bacterium]